MQSCRETGVGKRMETAGGRGMILVDREGEVVNLRVN